VLITTDPSAKFSARHSRIRAPIRYNNCGTRARRPDH
jgi:hypothetical protein